MFSIEKKLLFLKTKYEREKKIFEFSPVCCLNIEISIHDKEFQKLRIFEARLSAPALGVGTSFSVLVSILLVKSRIVISRAFTETFAKYFYKTFWNL